MWDHLDDNPSRSGKRCKCNRCGFKPYGLAMMILYPWLAGNVTHEGTFGASLLPRQVIMSALDRF